MSLFGKKEKHLNGRKYSEEELDELTGLLTIEAFRQHYRTALENSSDLKQNGAVIYFNICGFADFNDKYGYEAGDQLLRDFASALKKVFPGSMITHFASDHFYVLSVLEGAEDKILEIQSDLFRLRRQSNLHLAAGIYAISEEDNISSACDRAKTAGDTVHPGERQCYRIFDESMNANLKRRRYIVEHLDEALEKGWIKVYFQPVVRSVTGQLCGAEALARWQDPVYHLMPPGDFIEVLERERLIWKLDTYILKESCRIVHEKLAKGETPVPFSFNVSRLDFDLCDIFGILNQTAEEYEIPKEYINVEITERMLIDDAATIQKRIQRFHEDGYQVWMDDFGSEFSSLNILKDVDFDEIKIDMGFLRDFSERSRQIIISVVDMSKRLGIQTLAEGVETEEQLNFLRSIGCEKIQGYYYDRPEPPAEMEKTMQAKGIKTELPALRNYYDRMGEVNLLNGMTVSRGADFRNSYCPQEESVQSLCLVEFRDDQFHFLYTNKTWRRVLHSMGFSSPQEAEDRMNSTTLPAAKVFRKFARQLADSETDQHLNYVINENYCFFKGRAVAQAEGRVMIVLAMANLSEDADLRRGQKLDDTLRTLYSMYEEIFVAVPETDTIEQVFDESGKAHDIERSLHEELERNERELIYPGDRERYRTFADPSTMIQRIQASGRQFVSDYFRTRDAEGSFIWKTHIAILVQDHESNKVLVCIRTALNDNAQWTQLVAAILESASESGSPKLKGERNALVSSAGNSGDELSCEDYWKNIVIGSDLIGFWKDKNRRFLGVTQAFLDYYDLNSQNDIIGKTDEDMKWHVDPETFHEDEDKILKDGAHIINHPGQCIIRGEQRNILVSKFPLYKNGKIAGLIGYALDAGQLPGIDEKNGGIFETDELTGLSNMRGLIISAEQYVNSWLFEKTDFILIDIQLYGMESLSSLYGRRTAEHMLRELADVLRRTLGTSAVLARTAGNQFICLRQISGKKEITEIITKLKDALSSVHEADGQQFNTYLDVGWADMSECQNIEKMYQCAEKMIQTEREGAE